MMILWILAGTLGAFVLVWRHTLGRMSVAQQPKFSRSVGFRAGIPLLGGALFLAGFGLAVRQSPLWGGLCLAAVLLLAGLVLKHDQYAAMIRILYDDYFGLKRQMPEAKDFDLLFSIVKSRYPRWSEDRMMEVCVGKDIRQLVLLLILLEHEIHPLDDMPLYENLKDKVESLYPRS
ncbi:MAG: hypothetical protein AB1898_08890 [Acidobacteriota bacterium]